MKLYRCAPENNMKVAFEDGSAQDEGFKGIQYHRIVYCK